MNESNWQHFRSALAGGLIAALLMSAPAVTAAVGNAVEIGQVNWGNATTTLKGPSPGTLRLVNTTAGEEALQLVVESGPALRVNTRNRIPRLNADMLDGKHRSWFLAATGKAADSEMLDGRDSTEFLGATAQAADSDTVDGLHANQLVRVGYGRTNNAVQADGAAVTATITAPVPGLLVMSGAIDADGGRRDRYICRLKVDGSVVTGTKMESLVDGGEGSAEPPIAINDSENCATTGVQAVAAGAHTVTLDILNHNSLDFRGASVWALYVPFDGTGAAGGP